MAFGLFNTISHSSQILKNPKVETFQRLAPQGSFGAALLYVAAIPIFWGIILFALSFLIPQKNLFLSLMTSYIFVYVFNNVISNIISFILSMFFLSLSGKIMKADFKWKELTYCFALFSVPLSAIFNVLAIVLVVILIFSGILISLDGFALYAIPIVFVLIFIVIFGIFTYRAAYAVFNYDKVGTTFIILLTVFLNIALSAIILGIAYLIRA